MVTRKVIVVINGNERSYEDNTHAQRTPFYRVLLAGEKEGGFIFTSFQEASLAAEHFVGQGLDVEITAVEFWDGEISSFGDFKSGTDFEEAG